MIIVKVQLSLNSSDGVQHVLIYNKDKSIYYEDIADEAMIEAMAGKPKRYFNAELVDDRNSPGSKRINLDSYAEDQVW